MEMVKNISMLCSQYTFLLFDTGKYKANLLSFFLSFSFKETDKINIYIKVKGENKSVLKGI